MKSLGQCSFCHQPILMTQVELDIHQEEVHRRLQLADEVYGQEFDNMKYGEKVLIPLPHWPCGHYHTAIKRCIKKPNGKFSYVDSL